MRPTWLRAIVFALALVAVDAAADDLADFNAAVEDAAMHNRGALRHLRAGNADLAKSELESLRQAWGALVGKYGPNRPTAFRENPLYVTTFVDVQTRIIGADLVIALGRPDVAADSLAVIRKELSEMRRASGVEVLADCILDANGAMEALFVDPDHAFDWTKPETAADFGAKTGAYGAIIRRCDRMVSPALPSYAEFRHVIDGIAAALALVPKAVSAHDNDLLHRLLIELRSFDDLLLFRYG